VREIVVSAALLGPESDVELVCGALGEDEADVAAAMATASEHGIASLGDGRVAFRHALVQRAASTALSATERRVRIRAMARRLDAKAFPVEVAELLARSDDGTRADDAETIAAILRAANHSMNRSIDAAVSLLRRASARTAVSRELRSRVLTQLALAEAVSGRANAALRTATELDALLSGTDQQWRARVALAASSAIQGASEADRSLFLLDEALAIESLPKSWRAYLLASAAHVALFANRVEEARSLCESLRQIGPGAADGGLGVSRAHEVDACLALLTGDAATALAAGQRAVVALDAPASPISARFTVPHAMLATVELAVAGPEAALRSCEAGQLACERSGYRVAHVHLLTISAWGHLLDGAVARAAADLEESARLRAEADNGIPDPVAAALRALVEVWRYGGGSGDRRDDARGLLDEAISRLELHGASLLRGEVAAWAIAEAAVALGDASRGVAILRSVWTQLGGRFMTIVLPDAIRICRPVDPGLAEEMIEEARRRARSSTIAADALAVQCIDARLSSEPQLVEAAADALAAAGRRMDAARLLSSLPATEAGAAERLAALGVPWASLGRVVAGVEREPASTPELHGDRLAGLSRREREVVQHAASGLTNRQIGGQLFLSARTVETHLSSAMRKLGVTSRVQVASLLGPAAR
jgi:DNA-binding NarL/FixJ family response regulator